MAENGSILVTGAAGQLGAVGRTVTGLLLERGLPVCALVRREDDRAAALRAAGAEVVVGDLLEPADVYRVVSGRRGAYFGMSGIHVKRDNRRSIAYSEELIFPISATLQSTDRHHGIVGQEYCHFQRDS